MIPRSNLVGIRLAFAFFLTAGTASAQVDGSRNVELLGHRDDYVGSCANGWRYASCWSYVHGDGREYAAIGTCSGVLIYNVSVPTNPVLVADIPGVSYDIHHEMKSYQNFLYVVAEGPTDPMRGMQIIDMSDPDSPQLVGTYTRTFDTAHTVTLDAERVLLFCSGTRLSGVTTGLRILSIADPKNPVEVGSWSGADETEMFHGDAYVHDSWANGEFLYLSTPSGVRLLDVSNPSKPTEVAPLSTWGTHSTSAHGGDYLYLCDETPGQPMRTLWMNELTGTVVSEFKAIPQPGIADHVVHNPRVKGDELYLSSYIEGVRVLDISDPAHPAEFAWVDTYAGNSPRWYYGVWEVCPYFPSGIVIASDMTTGLYVFRPVRDYGILQVEVTDTTTGYALAGAAVQLTTQGDLLTTLDDGTVRFAPSPGTHTVWVTRSGYDAKSVTRSVSQGGNETVQIALHPIQTTDVNGMGTRSGRLRFTAVSPNPTRGLVSLTLIVPRAGPVDVQVLDVSGRRVRALHHASAAAGRLVLDWDGRDETGRSVAPGVYLLQTASGKDRADARLVRAD